MWSDAEHRCTFPVDIPAIQVKPFWTCPECLTQYSVWLERAHKAYPHYHYDNGWPPKTFYIQEPQIMFKGGKAEFHFPYAGLPKYREEDEHPALFSLQPQTGLDGYDPDVDIAKAFP